MKKKIIVTGIILFCLVSLIVFLCVKNINKSNEQSSNSNNFKIVTSFYPMYIIAENLTQNAQNIELSNMAEVNGGCLHDLARDLNLDIIMVETDHEESTLSADKLKELIKQVKESNIQVIIIGENDNTQNAETIAKETNAKIYKLKTGMGGDYSQDSYLKDMEYNLNVLKKIGK